MKLPAALAEDTKFEEQFKFEILDHQTALLTISEFAWEQDEKSYFEFTRDAFKQMRERGIQRLLSTFVRIPAAMIICGNSAY